jgi:hypothetical protein
MSKVPVDKTFLRHLFLKHKTFLHEIFHSKKKHSKVIIEKATNLQVNVLLRILYLIVHQAIPTPMHLVKSLSRTKKKILVTFNKNHRKVSNYLLKVPLKQKKFFLIKFVHYLPKLLTPLFQKNG